MRTLAKKSDSPLTGILKKAAPFLLLALFVGMLATFAPEVFATASTTAASGGGTSPTNNAENVVEALVTIVEWICSIVGVIFSLIGIVKFAISHANEDGPSQQKAAMMIATGIVLVILGALVLGQLDIPSWVRTSS